MSDMEKSLRHIKQIKGKYSQHLTQFTFKSNEMQVYLESITQVDLKKGSWEAV